MKTDFHFSKEIERAFKNDPPGQWMSPLPAGCLRLSSGYPAPSLVPSEEIKLAVARLLDEEQDLPLHYIGSPRVPQLKKFLQERMAQRDVKTTTNELLITSGACQAIDLIARILLDEEAVVAVESPTYMEALEIFRNYTDYYMTIPIDENGLQTDVLAEMLADRSAQGLPIPRLLYTIPTYQNPTGTTLSLERRQHVMELAEQYDFLVLEDDAYGELGFEERPRLLKAMDTQNRVIYVGSLSKVVAPGMRIGWVVADKRIIDPLSWFKKDLDHPFDQATMASFLEAIDFDEHLTRLTTTYKSKCAMMLAALEKFLPPTVSWFVPKGGYFVWIKIPDVDTSQLLQAAFDTGVAFVPGKHFFLNQQKGLEYLRLSFSYASEEEIVKGVELLGQVVGAYIAPTTENIE
ncbi:PLP-dependent aminotransferase family protein [Planococcus donghaensis]|uniref:Aminotransferase n=1 Tax=Planococcus donghaensis TaxID=414778 RepID=A0A1C7EL56_9BACL|nr:PLP-dependent aminotransferase family protein [Planococcus donghaensis]ANU24107.1 aminotransferase [Planococcus donghaensis]